MPSGRTHDRITLWGLPFVAGISYGQTQSSNLTLILSGAFLFSGLMFGPDLDLNSVQYKRWGYLRWIWIPYQKTLRHRSLLSHGPILGTTLRLIYLAVWLGLLGILVGIVQLVWDVGWNWQQFFQVIERSLTQYPNQWIAFYLGLEIGAMSHSVSDWGGSTYKRFKKQGRMKKRKLTQLTRRPKSVGIKSRQKH